MRNLVIVALVALAPYAAAQENYNVPASAQQVADLTAVVTGANLRTCLLWGKAAGCTDQGASGTCVAAGAAGGSSCTAAQARAANARIFPATQAGREEFVQFKIAAPTFVAMKNELPTFSRAAYCSWFGLQTQTTQDSECTKIGLSAGCSCPASGQE